MKNLSLANVINYQLNRKVERLCVGSKLGDVYFYENGILSKLTLHSGKETTFNNLVEYYQDKEKIPQLIGMNYLESSEAICFAFGNGDLHLYATVTNDLQCVGIVSTGVKTIAWSPDEEIFALITGEDNVIVMTSTFDPVNEAFLHQNNTGEKQFITVGWGKKETQFHGSEGKSAAKVTPLPCRPAFDWDDCQPQISWRGDGELFVVSTVNPDLNCRQLRFFNREGVLQCTSEPIDGLEGPVCWKPSGSLVASVQRLPNKHVVVFFEKNGLRHGDFSLPFEPDEVMVKNLCWNIDSTLLAVCCENLNSDGDNSGFLQFWACSNYHWYLKKVLNYGPYGKFTNFMWDINYVYRLHLLCESSVYGCHDFTWTVDHSKGKTEEDSAYVAVIDGDKLLMTPFRQMVIPPPMSAYTIHLPLPVSDVVFAPPITGGDELDIFKEHNQDSRSFSNNFFVVLNDNSIVIFSPCDNMVGEHIMNDGSTVSLTKVGAAEYKNTTKYHHPVSRFVLDWHNAPKELGKDFKKPLLRHWQWISERKIFCCFAIGHDTCICIMELCDTSLDASSNRKFIIRSSVNLLGSVVTVAVSFKENSSAIMQLQDGTLMRYAFSSGCMSNFTKSNGQPVDLLPVFVKMEVCSILDEEFIFGLTNKNRFYVNDREVLSDCSSFFVHSEYLLITTFRHTLLNILLTKNSIECFAAKKWETNSSENVRRIERGSRLVMAVPKHSRVILQMPRGNLECIQPRALSLHIVTDLVKRKKYDQAFDMVRTQRINLNVLCDLNPRDFINSLKEFVMQVKNPNWLCLFLCELQPENVFESMYSGFSYLKIDGENEKLDNKLNMICDGLRETMEGVDKIGYFLPLLTSYVMKKTSDDLVSALKRVRSIKEQAIGHKGEISSDEALKYLIYLVDVDTLYDAALRIYDFDLVMMIAAKSSKDPKEYIPFINGLRKLEINYQHYKIDMHLKSYSSALRNIAKCGEEHFDECLNLIRSQNLYTDAIKLFPKDGKFYRQICDAYADHLLEIRCYEEAGIMQKLSHNFEKAIISFEKAGNWRQTLILAKELQYNQSQMSKLCRELSSVLKERRKFSDAAFILNEYLRDGEECVEALTDGCMWDEAIRVAHQFNRLDLIETHVKPGIKDHFDTLSSRMNSNNDLFMKYKSRLSVLRAEKLKAQQENEEKEDEKNVVDEDLVSEASSVIGSAVGSSFHSSSRSSSRSSRSSKNRRKQERKFLSLKEGNPHEEVALITALKNIFESTFSQETKDEVKGLCVALLLYGHEEFAAQLQDLLCNMQKEMIRSRDEIWQIKDMEEHMQFGPHCTSNTISALASSNFSNSFSHTTGLAHVPPIAKADSSWKLNILVSSL